MSSFQDLPNQGAANAWLLIPSAILLGALHGLEPGHSKTMMAAFIVAIRGTVLQAVLLGISAAFSHSLIIWLLAAVALHYGSDWNAQTTESYFQMASGVIIVGMALWMFRRTRHDTVDAAKHSHEHRHGSDAPHGDEDHDHHHAGLDISDGSYLDAHELAHASEIAKRFTTKEATTGQIILFGLTGGLLPCPASLTVLLVCLQLKKFVLGFSLVLCFSFGLALTMVATGAAAAWGVKHASRKIQGFHDIARKAPYFSSVLLICLGITIGIQGWLHVR
jgi:ABC-type nickel/cobalt efflux system permease component RcnA